MADSFRSQRQCVLHEAFMTTQGSNSKGFMKGLATRMFGIDPRSLALFRVGLASLLLIDLLLRSFNIAEFYTDGGIFPRAQFLEVVRPWHFSIHAMSGSLGWQIILFVAAALAAFFLLVGYRTKWASIFSFLFLASLSLIHI